MDRVFWFIEENTYVWCDECQRFVSAVIEQIDEEKWKLTWCHGERYPKEKPHSVLEEMLNVGCCACENAIGAEKHLKNAFKEMKHLHYFRELGAIVTILDKVDLPEKHIEPLRKTLDSMHDYLGSKLDDYLEMNE